MLLHNDKKHTVLISPADSKLINALDKLGVKCICSVEVSELIEYERFHADMQLLAINDTAFIPENASSMCEKLKPYFRNIVVTKPLNNKYPDNVSLNAALVGSFLFCKKTALAAEVLEYCDVNNIEVIDVKQGYAKCSTLILRDAIITADASINSAALKAGIKCLFIEPRYIELKGTDYGFIGGASGVIGDTVYFFGDIKKHPDCNRILEFIESNQFEYVSLTNETLSDIGGFVLIK